MEQTLRKLLPRGRFENVPADHSARMRAIKSRGNRSTERRARAILIRAGISGWKLHPTDLVGNPDFLFSMANLILFIDGCYWHGCERCSHAAKKNQRYWNAKIQGNIGRDLRNNRALRGAGYRVIRVWEHELISGCDGRWLRRLRQLLDSPGDR